MNFTIKLPYGSITEFLASQVKESRSLVVVRGGMFVQTPKALPVGTDVTFAIALKDGVRVLQGNGIVKWSAAPGTTDAATRSPGMEVQFADLSEDSRALVDAIVSARERLSANGAVRPVGETVPLPSPSTAAAPPAIPMPSKPSPSAPPPPAFDIVEVMPWSPVESAVAAPTFDQVTESLQAPPPPPLEANEPPFPPAPLPPPPPPEDSAPSPAGTLAAVPPAAPTPDLAPPIEKPVTAANPPAVGTKQIARSSAVRRGAALGVAIGVVGALGALASRLVERAPPPAQVRRAVPGAVPAVVVPAPPSVVAQTGKPAVAAAAPSSPPPTPGGLKVGALRFQGLPDGAKVTLDSYGVPNPAADQYLAAGPHTVAVDAKGFLPFEEHLELAVGQVQTVTVDLRPRPVEPHGTAEVSCQPWCQIWVDQRDSKKISPARLSLTAGTHTLTLANPPAGLSKKLTVKVPENGELREIVRLDQ